MTFLTVAVTFAALFAVAEWLVADRTAAVLARVYLGWWGVHLLASSLDPLSMYPVSPFTYGVLLLNVALFTAGFIAVGHQREVEEGGATVVTLSRSLDAVVRNRVVLAGLLAFFLYLFRYYLKYQEVLGDLGPAEARNIRFSIGPLFANALEVLVFNYLAEALATLLAVIVACSLVLGSIRTWGFLLAALNLVLFTGIGAGRTLIVQVAIFVLLLALVRNSLYAVPGEGAARPDRPVEAPPPRKNLLLYVGLPVLLMTAFMVYLTFARIFSLESGLAVAGNSQIVGAAAEAFLDNAQVYTVGPFRALDQAVQHPSVFGFQFGRLTFGALDEIVGYPFRLLGYDYPVVNHLVGEKTQDVIFIGSGDFNALYTGVFRFYLDIGLAGVALFAFLLGASVRASLLWFQGSPSLATLTVLLFLFTTAILSTQTWYLASPSAVVLLGGATLLHRWRPEGP